MNPDNLTRQAIRLAQRESRKRGHALARDEVLRLTIQTVEPWKRALFALLGLGVVGFAWFCYFAGAPWWVWAPGGVGGMIVVVLGLVGRKEYLDRELQKMSKEGPTRITDAVLNALL
jgi:hypothetical protein